MRFDPQGNLYSISESNPGYIFKFVPDVHGDLSSGQSYALKIVNATGDRVGEAEWIPLDRDQVETNADVAAAAVSATGYNRRKTSRSRPRPAVIGVVPTFCTLQ